LGLSLEGTVSPRVLAKVVYAGATASFPQAEQDLLHLANLSISSERVRRACHRIGDERIAEHDTQQAAYESLPLPQQIYGQPDDVDAPSIACVMADGGRYQQLDRGKLNRTLGKSACKGEHWKESRIGILLSMSGDSYDTDPQPRLPPELCYDAMAETLADLGKTGAKLDSSADDSDHDEVSARGCRDGLAGPTLQQRDVVASRLNWDDFGSLLASRAWQHGFAASSRKVFVSDGSAAIEKLQRRHFSHYTSVLDLLHALSYGLAAARAVSRDETAARAKYDAWAALIWQGRVDDVIAELIAYGSKLGPPPPDAKSDDAKCNDPREVVRVSRVYYENHSTRMNYPEYRRQGFPLTSSLMESAVKQVGRRVKGSEKYWSSHGGEALLRLRGEYLSDSKPMQTHWANHPQRATGQRTHAIS